MSLYSHTYVHSYIYILLKGLKVPREEKAKGNKFKDNYTMRSRIKYYNLYQDLRSCSTSCTVKDTYASITAFGFINKAENAVKNTITYYKGATAGENLDHEHDGAVRYSSNCNFSSNTLYAFLQRSTCKSMPMA